MKFCYIIALFNWKRNSQPKGKAAVLALKLLLTFIGIVIATVILLKIYEVPVNRTNLCVEYNTDSIDISIKLVRDFDLLSHISRDTTHSKWEYGDHTGKILVEGFAYSKKSDNINSSQKGNMSKSTEIHLRNMLLDQFKKVGRADFVDSVTNLVYVRCHGTERQFFRIRNTVSDPIFLYDDSCDVYYNNDTISQYWSCNYCLIHANKPHNYFISEDISTSGIGDDSTLFVTSYQASSLDKPNFFMTAEDFSKMVEEIRFDSLDANEIHKLDIDYKGATIFGVLTPKPDSMTISSIHYYTPEKISQIAKDGLKYQVRFPELENMQEVRIFFVTMVLAGLLGVFFNLLYRLCRPTFLNLWSKKSENIISWLILISILLVGMIIYFVYTSIPASYTLDKEEFKPYIEIGS